MPHLTGALITRVDRPLPSLFVISLEAEHRSQFLALAGGPERPQAAAAWLPTRPRGQAADAQVRGLREKLEGGRIVESTLFRGIPRLVVRRGETSYVVTLSPPGLTASLAPSPLTLITPAEIATDLDEDQMAALARAGDTFVAAHAHGLAERERTIATRAIARAEAKLRRRIEAIEGDGQAVAKADEEAAHARLFVPAAHQASPGAEELVTTDWSTGEAHEIRFRLTGDRPARAELETIFARAKRLRKGLELGRKRSDEARHALELLQASARRVALAEDSAAVRREIAHLTEALPGDVRVDRRDLGEPASKPHGSPSPTGRLPYRAFRSGTGVPLLVGKGSEDNDRLTVGIARPHDWFLHAKQAKGAHVIAVRPDKNRPLHPGALLDGALLAAHFSSERDEAVVDVQCCERRHLRKRKGAPPGLVELTREKIIAVRRDDAALTRLLATENR